MKEFMNFYEQDAVHWGVRRNICFVLEKGATKQILQAEKPGKRFINLHMVHIV